MACLCLPSLLRLARTCPALHARTTQLELWRGASALELDGASEMDSEDVTVQRNDGQLIVDMRGADKRQGRYRDPRDSVLELPYGPYPRTPGSGARTKCIDFARCDLRLMGADLRHLRATHALLPASLDVDEIATVIGSAPLLRGVTLSPRFDLACWRKDSKARLMRAVTQGAIDALELSVEERGRPVSVACAP